MLNGPKLMGRQVAGDGFLRAAVKAHGGEPLVAYTAHEQSANVFRARVRELDPTAKPQWLPAHRLDLLPDLGVLYRPDHALADHAYARLRMGSAAYSLCGVTHTLSSHGAMSAATTLATAPVMPWDAVVCTSQGARGVIERLFEAQEAYLRWRLGSHAGQRPQLPVIPLGVHMEDFAFTQDERALARRELGIGNEEITALFPGRIAYHAKVNPYALYRAFQRVAEQTRTPLVLLHAGQFPNDDYRRAYDQAVRRFCPDVRCLFLDGKDPALYGRGWRAADLFVSPSDNIQETFGITPIEAMAAGLPVLVTDWNGYKDTVRDGIDGFRVATWQPAAGAGEAAARRYEVIGNYELHLVRTSLAVSVDMPELVSRLTELVTNPDLRRRMGAAGQARVKETFRWEVVYAQYQALWRELGDIRRRMAKLADGAPRAAPHYEDPFKIFEHYPTWSVGPDTRAQARQDATADEYQEITDHPFLSYRRVPRELVERSLEVLRTELTCEAFAAKMALRQTAASELLSRLAKMDLVRLRQP
jgi:glycosyltransferase involved in cell wall biosynthesis